MRLRKQAVRSRLHPFYYVLCLHLYRRAINRDKPLLEGAHTDITESTDGSLLEV